MSSNKQPRPLPQLRRQRNPAQLEQPEVLEFRAQVGRLDRGDTPEQRVQRVMQDATEPRASLAKRAIWARPVDRESGDIVGMKAPLEARDLPVRPGWPDVTEQRELTATPAAQEPRESRVTTAQLEQREAKDQPEDRELPDHQDHKDGRDRPAPLETPVTADTLATPDHKAVLVTQGSLAHEVPPATRVALDPPDRKVCGERPA